MNYYSIAVNNYKVISIDNLSLISIEKVKINNFDFVLICGDCVGKVIANDVQIKKGHNIKTIESILAEFTHFNFYIADDFYTDRLIINKDKIVKKIFDYGQNKYNLLKDVELIDFSLEELLDYITIKDISIDIVKECLEDEINESSSYLGFNDLDDIYIGQLTRQDSVSFDNADLTCNLHSNDVEFRELI